MAVVRLALANNQKVAFIAGDATNNLAVTVISSGVGFPVIVGIDGFVTATGSFPLPTNVPVSLVLAPTENLFVQSLNGVGGVVSAVYAPVTPPA